MNWFLRMYDYLRLCKHKYSSFCVDDVYDAKQLPSSERRHTEIATLMAGTDTTDTLLQAAASDGKTSMIFNGYIFTCLFSVSIKIGILHGGP